MTILDRAMSCVSPSVGCSWLCSTKLSKASFLVIHTDTWSLWLIRCTCIQQVYTVLYHIHHFPIRRQRHEKKCQGYLLHKTERSPPKGRSNYIRYLKISVFWHYIVEAASKHELVSFSEQAQPRTDYGAMNNKISGQLSITAY